MGKIRHKIFGIGMITAGLGLFWYPDIQTGLLNLNTEQIICEFEKASGPDDKEKENDLLWKDVCEYNRSVYVKGQVDLGDDWSLGEESISQEEDQDEIFGYIKIPVMKVKLPLYTGATREHLASGAAILAGSSLPVGGENTNSVIAGHRGYRGAPYFRDIEKLRPGDKVLITNPWETLCYRVEYAAVIAPDDSSAVKIQEGKDMITLLTCHPYRSHGIYRYVVYCIRSDGLKSGIDDQNSRNMTEDSIVYESSQADIRTEQLVRTCAGILFVILSGVVIFKKLLNKNMK